MNANYRERLKDKKRIVIKIGSSSLKQEDWIFVNWRSLQENSVIFTTRGKMWFWYLPEPLLWEQQLWE